MKPLLAHTYEPHRIPTAAPLHVQPKLNGVRALAGIDNQNRWRFQSRDELAWDYEILEHVACELDRLAVPKDWVLDGELYVHGWPLQKINGAITPVRKERREDTALVEYHIFDRVDFHQSFIERFNSVYSCLAHQSSIVRMVRTYMVGHNSLIPTTADDYYAQFVAEGYEGMMYRLGTCPYTKPKQLKTLGGPSEIGGARSAKFLSDKNNRTWHLLKRKDWQDGEFECLGVTEGEGKRAGMIGSFECASHATRPGEGRHSVFSVGSFLGFTDADLTHYLQNPPIGRKLKVKYLCLSSAGIPLNPTLLTVL